MWNRLFVEGDILGDRGAGADWALSTIDSTRWSYGKWLAWTQDNMREFVCVSPVRRVTPETVKAYTQDLQTKAAPGTVTSHVLNLLRVVLAMEASSDWQWLRDIHNRLKAQNRPARSKVSKLRASEELFDLGIALMETSSEADCRKSPQVPFVQYRDGLIIAILAARPVRLKNLASIQTGRHLVKVDQVYWLRFPADEVKNRKTIECPLPNTLTSYIDKYLTWVRKISSSHSDRMPIWVSPRGLPLAKKSIYWRVSRRTETAFGEAISPHLFRDCAATSIAIEDAKHVHITAGILGHTSLETSQKYYNQAQMLEASRTIQAAVSVARQSETTI
jgi:integrase/recombinase XerD